MILEEFGILAAEQTITGSTSDDSDNVILTAAIDYTQLTDLWWVVDTHTAATGDGSDTFDFILYISQESTLDTNIEVMSVGFTGIADIRAATAGRHIAAFNIGNQLANMLTTTGSDYPYIGMIITVSAGGVIIINAALSPSKPRTEDNQQVVRSNVGVPT